MSMRMLFISNLFPDLNDLCRGQDNANLLHHLSRSVEIQVISPRPRLLFNGKVMRPRNCDLLFNPRYVEFLYVPKVGTLFNHYLYYYFVRKQFIETVISFRPQLILVSWAYPDAVAIISLALSLGLPSVVITQGSDVHIYTRMPLRAKIICNALNNSDRVITRSIKLGDILKQKGVLCNKVLPVYNGVDQQIFCYEDKGKSILSLELEHDTRYILYVGNFYTVKNPELLIRSFEIVKSHFVDEDIRLLLIGEGYLREQLQALVKELGLWKFVDFLGRLPLEKISSYMQASDLLCIPSFNEGLPNVLLEALSCGLPVVATDVGGISEVLNSPECGALVSSFNPIDYSAAIIRQMNLTKDRKLISKLAKGYSWDHTTQQYLDVFHNVLNS